MELIFAVASVYNFLCFSSTAITEKEALLYKSQTLTRCLR